MSQTLKIIAVAIIVIGLYLGVRYVGSVIHYACANPAEDCPPPFALAGEFGYVVTGGDLVPLWRKDLQQI